MPGFYVIQSETSGLKTEWYGGKGYYYRCSGNRLLEVQTTMRWCASCDGFVNAEKLPTKSECIRQLEHISMPDAQRKHNKAMSAFLGIVENRLNLSYDDKVSEAALWVELITNRVSQCRCLNCESTELIDQWTGDGVIVPSRGIFRVTWMGMYSGDYTDRYYTTEGARLPD